MRGWLTLTLGLLAVVVGAVWALQGLGYVGGSVMTGQPLWAVVGPVVALGGVVLIALGLRARRRSAAGSGRPDNAPTSPDNAGA